MLNQIVPAATEANSSGLFLKGYLEYIEEFPGNKNWNVKLQGHNINHFYSSSDDIMRIVSICRELDTKTNSE